MSFGGKDEGGGGRIPNTSHNTRTKESIHLLSRSPGQNPPFTHQHNCVHFPNPDWSSYFPLPWTVLCLSPPARCAFPPSWSPFVAVWPTRDVVEEKYISCLIHSWSLSVTTSCQCPVSRMKKFQCNEIILFYFVKSQTWCSDEDYITEQSTQDKQRLKKNKSFTNPLLIKTLC